VVERSGAMRCMVLQHATARRRTRRARRRISRDCRSGLLRHAPLRCTEICR
jgi:hypothetical protein